ncbi:hypothetical protein [Halorussus amylolyticus]|uniref:hypothetical protein n=1 Tax=Halorussus amylolyticus TaxID=1126242 RepID=UPI001044ECB9|nr:hypothetical protein [Halorussus amylolyticus]
MAGIEFFTRDYKEELVKGLKSGGEAVTAEGYKLHGYHFRASRNDDFQSTDVDPKPALENLLAEMHGENFLGPMHGEPITALFEYGPQDGHELLTNQILRQVEGQLDIEPTDSPVHPGLLEVVYRVRTDGNYFELDYRGGRDSRETISDIRRILEDEGFDVI